VDLDSIADELYGLPLADFTSTRTSVAKQARAVGDRQLAADIQAMRKPTQAAWLLNQLVRAHRDEIELLIDLGRELRDVMADVDADALRQLSRQRYQLVSALVEQTRALAVAQGRRMSDDVAAAVRTTLEATLSDEPSAQALATAQLTEPLEVSGFGAGNADAELRRPAKPPRHTQQTDASAGSVTDLAAERRRRERSAAEEAAKQTLIRAEQARAEADRASDELAAVRAQVHDATDELERIRVQLADVEQSLVQLRATEQQAQTTADTATEAASEASQAAEAARRHRDALDD
jgi:hypothetical protein